MESSASDPTAELESREGARWGSRGAPLDAERAAVFEGAGSARRQERMEVIGTCKTVGDADGAGGAAVLVAGG